MRRALVTAGLVGLVGMLGAAAMRTDRHRRSTAAAPARSPTPTCATPTTPASRRTSSRSTSTRRRGRTDARRRRSSRTCTAARSSIGDKANKIADKVELFTDAGWAFASLNYRLVDDPGAGPTQRRVPRRRTGHRRRARVPRRPRERVRARRRTEIMLLGHSAGAFLVSLVSTDGSFVEGAGIEPERHRLHRAARHHLRHPRADRERRHRRGDVPQRVRRRPGRVAAGVAAEQRRGGQGHPRLPHRHPRCNPRASPRVKPSRRRSRTPASTPTRRSSAASPTTKSTPPSAKPARPLVTKPLMDFYRNCAS